MEALTNAIYNTLWDMDFMDYDETNLMDLENLMNDLELLEKEGNGTLLNAIKMIVENN